MDNTFGGYTFVPFYSQFNSQFNSHFNFPFNFPFYSPLQKKERPPWVSLELYNSLTTTA